MQWPNHAIHRPALPVSHVGMSVSLGNRSLFPHLKPRVYANHAAVSPPSSRVVAAANKVLLEYAETGLGAIFPWMEQRTHLKTLLGQLLHVAPERLALSSSTNRALTDLAHCLPWRDGDRVLCFEGEFPANVTPWQQAAPHYGATCALLPLDPDAQLLERLEIELRFGARYVAVSAVQFQTGRRMPLGQMAALCHQHHAELIVDGIQAIGIVPLDLAKLGVDYLAGGGHKWLMGLEGCGFLYVAPGRTLVPRVAGWLSHQEPVGFLMEGAGHLRYDRPMRESPDFLEIGSTNAVGFAALQAGLEPILELGVERIFEHVQAWNSALETGLLARGFVSARDPENPSGTLAVRLPEESILALADGLKTAGISASTPDGWLRFAPHWPNAQAEVKRVLESIDALRGAP